MNLKKLLALILALMMVLSSLPMAFAEAVSEAVDEEVLEVEYDLGGEGLSLDVEEEPVVEEEEQIDLDDATADEDVASEEETIETDADLAYYELGDEGGQEIYTCVFPWNDVTLEGIRLSVLLGLVQVTDAQGNKSYVNINDLRPFEDLQVETSDDGKLAVNLVESIEGSGTLDADYAYDWLITPGRSFTTWDESDPDPVVISITAKNKVGQDVVFEITFVYGSQKFFALNHFMDPYATFAGILSDVNNGDTIILMDNYTVGQNGDQEFVERQNGNFTLDLSEYALDMGGQTLTVYGKAGYEAGLTLTAEEGGTFVGDISVDGEAKTVLTINDEDVTVFGHISAAKKGEVEIYAGTYSEEPDEDFIVDGYVAVPVDDMWVVTREYPIKYYINGEELEGVTDTYNELAAEDTALVDPFALEDSEYDPEALAFDGWYNESEIFWDEDDYEYLPISAIPAGTKVDELQTEGEEPDTAIVFYGEMDPFVAEIDGVKYTKWDEAWKTALNNDVVLTVLIDDLYSQKMTGGDVVKLALGEELLEAWQEEIAESAEEGANLDERLADRMVETFTWNDTGYSVVYNKDYPTDSDCVTVECGSFVAGITFWSDDIDEFRSENYSDFFKPSPYDTADAMKYALNTALMSDGVVLDEVDEGEEPILWTPVRLNVVADVALNDEIPVNHNLRITGIDHIAMSNKAKVIVGSDTWLEIDSFRPKTMGSIVGTDETSELYIYNADDYDEYEEYYWNREEEIWVLADSDAWLYELKKGERVFIDSFHTVQEAIDAAEEGMIVELRRDNVEVDDAIYIDKSITLDLNGKSVNSDANNTVYVTGGAEVVVMNGGLLNDNESVNSCTVFVDSGSLALVDVTVETATLYAAGTTANGKLIVEFSEDEDGNKILNDTGIIGQLKVVDASITDGYFTDPDVAVLLEKEYVAVYVEESEVEPLYHVVPAVAFIESTAVGYYTLEEAFAAAEDGDYIYLLADCTLEDTIEVDGKSITLEMESFDISGAEIPFELTNEAGLTIIGDADDPETEEIEASVITGQLKVTDGALVIDGGIIDGNEEDYSVYLTKGSLTMSNATVAGAKEAAIFVDGDAEENSVSITLTGDNVITDNPVALEATGNGLGFLSIDSGTYRRIDLPDSFTERIVAWGNEDFDGENADEAVGGISGGFFKQEIPDSWTVPGKASTAEEYDEGDHEGYYEVTDANSVFYYEWLADEEDPKKIDYESPIPFTENDSEYTKKVVTTEKLNAPNVHPAFQEYGFVCWTETIPDDGLETEDVEDFFAGEPEVEITEDVSLYQWFDAPAAYILTKGIDDTGAETANYEYFDKATTALEAWDAEDGVELHYYYGEDRNDIQITGADVKKLDAEKAFAYVDDIMDQVQTPASVGKVEFEVVVEVVEPTELMPDIVDTWEARFEAVAYKKNGDQVTNERTQISTDDLAKDATLNFYLPLSDDQFRMFVGEMGESAQVALIQSADAAGEEFIADIPAMKAGEFWEDDQPIQAIAVTGMKTLGFFKATNAVAMVTNADGELVDRYNDLEAAIEAANAAAGSTLTLLKDISLSGDGGEENLKVTGTFTLDLNGQELSNGSRGIDVSPVAPSASAAPAPNTLTIIDSTSTEEENGKGVVESVSADGGNLVFESGNAVYIDQKGAGEVTIAGGSIDGVTVSYKGTAQTSTLTITGGEFDGDIGLPAPLYINPDSTTKVTISGGEFINDDRYAVYNGGVNPVEITGGMFGGGYDVDADVGPGDIAPNYKISGGYFYYPVAQKDCAEGYYPTSSFEHFNESEWFPFTVLKDPVVMLTVNLEYATVLNGVYYYAGLNDALDALTFFDSVSDGVNSATIKMLQDDPNAVQTVVSTGNDLTIDLNSKKVTFRALTEDEIEERIENNPFEEMFYANGSFGLLFMGDFMGDFGDDPVKVTITDNTPLTTEEQIYGSITGKDVDVLISAGLCELTIDHAQLVNKNGIAALDAGFGNFTVGEYTTIEGGRFAVNAGEFSHVDIGENPETKGILLSADEVALRIDNTEDTFDGDAINVRAGVFVAEEPFKVVKVVEDEETGELVEQDDLDVTGFVYGGYFSNIIPNRFVANYVPGFFDGWYEAEKVIDEFLEGDYEWTHICGTVPDAEKQLRVTVYSLKEEMLVVLDAGDGEFTYEDMDGEMQPTDRIAFGVPSGETVFNEGVRDEIRPYLEDESLMNDQWLEYTEKYEEQKMDGDDPVLFNLDEDEVNEDKYLEAQYTGNAYTVIIQVDTEDFVEDEFYTKYLKTDKGIIRTVEGGVVTAENVPYGFSIDDLILLEETEVPALPGVHEAWTFDAELTREFYEVDGWTVLSVEVEEDEELPVTREVWEEYLNEDGEMIVEPRWVGVERVITMENGEGEVINVYRGHYGDAYDVDTLNNILAGTLDFDSYDAMIEAIGNDGMDYIYRVDKLDDEFNANHTLNIDQPFEPAVEEIELTEDLVYSLNWIETYPINFVEVDEEDEENFWEIGETVRYTELMTVADIIVPDVQDYYDPTSQLQSWLDESGEVYDFEAHAEDAIAGAMTFTLCITDAEARIGDQPYATLAEAVEAAEEGDVIELLTPSKEGYTLKDADDAVTVKLVGVDPETGDPLTADDANITAPEGSMVIATADEEDDSLITFTSAEEKVIIKSRSAEFKGQISLALKYKIDDDLLNRDDIYVVFSNGDTELKRMLLSDFSAQHLFPTDADDEYWYLCPIIIKQFTDEITAKVVKVVDGKDVPVKCVNEAGDKDFTTTGYKYSIEQYLNNQRNGNGPMSKFAQAAYDYGVAAQIKFAYGTHMSEEVSDAVKAVEASDLAETITDGQKPDGVKASINVNFSSDNSLYVYFTLPEGKTLDDYLWSMDDEAIAPVPSEDGTANKYQYKVPNVAAKNLSDPHTFSITDKVDSSVIFTVETSCIGYARTSIQSKTSAEDMKNLARALYLYNETAIAYFGGNE